MENYTPTSARKNLYQIIKQVNVQKKPVRISSTKNKDESAVIVSAADWDSIQETLYLESTGTMAKVRERLTDKENEWTEIDNVEDIDWDNL